MKKLLLAVIVAFFANAAAMASLQEMASALDETIKSVETKVIAGDLAQKVGVPAAVAQSALLDKKLKLSELALAKFVCEKAASDLNTVLEHPPTDWSSFLQKNNVSESDAEEYLDSLQTEVALMMLDYREHRRG